MLITCVDCVLGQVVAAIGVQNTSWPGLLSGRFVFGLGMEAVIISIDTFLASVFAEGRRLGVVFGLCAVTCSYIGYLLSTILGPVAANRVDPAFAFWLGLIMICASLLAVLAIRHKKIMMTAQLAAEMECSRRLLISKRTPQLTQTPKARRPALDASAISVRFNSMFCFGCFVCHALSTML